MSKKTELTVFARKHGFSVEPYTGPVLQFSRYGQSTSVNSWGNTIYEQCVFYIDFSAANCGLVFLNNFNYSNRSTPMKDATIALLKDIQELFGINFFAYTDAFNAYKAKLEQIFNLETINSFRNRRGGNSIVYYHLTLRENS